MSGRASLLGGDNGQLAPVFIGSGDGLAGGRKLGELNRVIGSRRDFAFGYRPSAISLRQTDHLLQRQETLFHIGSALWFLIIPAARTGDGELGEAIFAKRTSGFEPRLPLQLDQFPQVARGLWETPPPAHGQNI